MMKTIAKWCAKIALQYLPDVAVWVIEQATGKAGESAKAMRVLSVVKQVASDASKLAEVMEDGKFSTLEKSQVQMRASVLAEELTELL